MTSCERLREMRGDFVADKEGAHEEKGVAASLCAAHRATQQCNAADWDTGKEGGGSGSVSWEPRLFMFERPFETKCETEFGPLWTPLQCFLERDMGRSAD